MMYFYHFDLSEFLNDKINGLYINYLLEKSNKTQKEIILETNISHATFTRAKKNGFENNGKVLDVLYNYFGVKKADLRVLRKLEEEWDILYTYIYYLDASEQEKAYYRLLKILDLSRNTPLEALNIALLSLSMNTMLYQNDISLLDSKIDLIEYYIPYLNDTNKTLFWFSLNEYGLHKKDINITLKYGHQIEGLISKIPDQFQPSMDLLVMNNAFLERDYYKGIIYANKVIDYQKKYMSPAIRITAVYALNSFFSMTKDFDKIIESAENEVIYLQFEEKYQLQYFSMVFSLINAYIAKNRYDDAFKMIDVINNYDFESKEKLNKAYVPMLKNRQRMTILSKMFIYYKEKDKTRLMSAYDTIMNDEIEEMKIYCKMILYLFKGNKTSIKKLGEDLLREENNKLLQAYTNIHYLIKKEYLLKKDQI